jgi:hypothetical protein
MGLHPSVGIKTVVHDVRSGGRRQWQTAAANNPSFPGRAWERGDACERQGIEALYPNRANLITCADTALYAVPGFLPSGETNPGASAVMEYGAFHTRSVGCPKYQGAKLMLRRCLSLAALVGLLASTLPVRAADADSAPSLVIRARSIDGLLEDARALVTMLGKGEEAKQFDGFIKSMMGPKGLEGIDTKKPLGFYGTVGPNGIDSTGIVLVPIADEKAFLALLERLDLKTEKAAGGLYSFSPPRVPVTVYFRFANGYLYGTAENKGAVAKEKLLPVADVLPSNLTSALSLTVRFDQIPKEIKQLALQQMALKVADAQGTKLPNESDVQQQFRSAILKDFERRTAQVLEQGRSFSLRLNLDREKKQIVADASLTGQPASKLAGEIADMGKSTSLFVGDLGTDAAVSLLAHATLPPEVRKAMEPVIDEGMKLALEKEKDEKRRAIAEKFLTIIGPTLKSGDFDGAVTVRGPNKDGKYAVLLGVKLADGSAVEKGFRNIVLDLRKEEQEKIKFDVDKAGGYKIHMLEVKKELDDKAKRLFGESQIYMAFRNDAWLLAGGASGLEVLKDALLTKPKEGPNFQFEMAVKRVAPAMEADNPNLAKIIASVFEKEPDSDKVRFVVEGGKSLRTHFTIDTAVVKFFAELGRSKKKPDADKE